MRFAEIFNALKPLCGLVLLDICDDDRQEHMDRILQVVRGWQLEQIHGRREAVVSHPEGRCDVSLVFVHNFSDGPAEFTLQMLARTIHRIRELPDADRLRRIEILFKRGSTSILVFGPAPEEK